MALPPTVVSMTQNKELLVGLVYHRIELKQNMLYVCRTIECDGLRACRPANGCFAHTK
jgi:hypothetical protein